MVEKVIIKDNMKSPIYYLGDLPAFKNGKEFIFKEGVNIIVGENGSGKSTLLKLIKNYLLVDFTECSEGECNINALFHYHKKDISDNFLQYKKILLDGVEVFADYKKNTFNLYHFEEKIGNNFELKTFNSFGTYYNQLHSSSGEKTLITINSLFEYIFNKNEKLFYDYSQFKNSNYGEYADYVEQHRIENSNEWTIIMDEPDRNLSLNNISQIKSILSFHKPNTQLIVVIHNPLLIYTLSNNKDINFIEMSDNYINSVKKEIENLIKK
jgi:predicted ATPase